MVREWSADNVGYSGWCRKVSDSSMYGLLGTIADSDSSSLKETWFYSGFDNGLKCDSHSTGDAAVFCLSASTTNFYLLIINKSTFEIERKLEVDSFSNAYFPISSHHISALGS